VAEKCRREEILNKKKKKAVTETRQFQYIVLKLVFFDKVNGKDHTHTTKLRQIFGDINKRENRQVTDTQLHQQVSSAIFGLHSKKFISKPVNSTKQDGKWTMTASMVNHFRKRFVKRKRYKHKYCSHLIYDRILEKRRCIACSKIICNPMLQCGVIQATVYGESEFSKHEIPVCSGYTQEPSNEHTLEISKKLVDENIKNDIKFFVNSYKERKEFIQLRPVIRNFLPYRYRPKEQNYIEMASSYYSL